MHSGVARPIPAHHSSATSSLAGGIYRVLVISRTPASCSNLLFVDVIKVHPFVFTLLYVLRTATGVCRKKQMVLGTSRFEKHLVIVKRFHPSKTQSLQCVDAYCLSPGDKGGMELKLECKLQRWPAYDFS